MAKELSTKEKVYKLLEEHNRNFVSGQDIADSLYLTRAGVWKAIKSLRESGIEIEAVSNRGYRLMLSKDILLKSSIDSMVKEQGVNIETYVYDEVESTNDVARSLAIEGKEDLVVISDFQSKGRGRRGRSFYSPKGSGLYMSFLLHPKMDISKATQITCMTAVAACRAIEKVTKRVPSIKWVNDIYMDDLKVSGILTEGFTSLEDGSLSHVIVGIGLNLYLPPNGFPEDIKNKAGVIFPDGENEENVRNKLCAEIITEFIKLYNKGEDADFIDEYRDRSNLIGHYVKIMQAGETTTKDYAKVVGIDDECHLMVLHDDGREEILSTGEVSVVKY